ncbi:hypothetical protein J3D45_001890 [Microbacterium foliorum]|uniref:hypothetical protein n=1 Tax=Microbacterium foliorum TaxID=104336 RepID=UPI00209CD7F9|nr:hypothetical protein [Microbacterium foliorum]MCP1429392.1 hypothetical protein [Microbacterium foliorum]
MEAHVRLPHVIGAAQQLADGLENPCRLVTLHRDIDQLHDGDGNRLGQSKKQHALRWAVFTMAFGAIEAFFNDILRSNDDTRVIPLNPARLRDAGAKHDVRLFTNEWAVRTRALLHDRPGRRSRWIVYSGTQQLNAYLADMKMLRDLLNHGQDPRSVSNRSGALWPLADGRKSMRLMGAEGFIQACCDLASHTVVAYGGRAADLPSWPEPKRSGLAAEPKPDLELVP